MGERGGKRWAVAAAGTLLQLCMGTVYAWSYFQRPMTAAYGWSNVQAAWVFSLAICFLGLAAAWGGANLARLGPRRLAAAGAFLYGAGWLAGAYALSVRSLPLLYLGYGAMGGIGLGLGYVAPVATVSKWFPDKKGLVTGMVVMGFGLGALLMSKLVAPVLMRLSEGDLAAVFARAGLVIWALALPSGLALRNPQAGFSPGSRAPGSAPAAAAAGGQPAAGRRPAASGADGSEAAPLWAALASGRFLKMWLVFFLNIAAGIMFVGLQSPMLQDLLRKSDPALSEAALAAAGATLIGASSLFNGLGRLFWGALSDRIGRVRTFRLILGSQVLAFGLLALVPQPLVFGALVCYVLLCYGGGFGTMPSFVLDEFGPRLMPLLYGTVLTAWSLGGIVGPQIAAFLKDAYPAAAGTLTFAAGAALLGAGFAVSLGMREGGKEAR